jgi:hypothetical protein
VSEALAAHSPLWRQYWNEAHWRISPKGNSYVMLDGFGTVTVFPARTGVGWTWSIARTATDRAYAPRAYDTEDDARVEAWRAIVAAERAK